MQKHKRLLLTGKWLLVIGLTWPMPFGFILKWLFYNAIPHEFMWEHPTTLAVLDYVYSIPIWFESHEYWWPNLGIIAIGFLICVLASMKQTDKILSNVPFKSTPVALLFIIIKWCAIGAVCVNLACLLLLGYVYTAGQLPTYAIGFAVVLALLFFGGMIDDNYKHYDESQPKRDYRYSRPECECQVSCIRSVGLFSRHPVLEIYIKTCDGDIPCFYIRNHVENETSGGKFNACIQFQSNTYLNRTDANGRLSTKQKIQLVEYLESGSGAYKNWYRLIDEWNYGNNNTMLPYNLEMPDYSAL